MGAEYVIGVNAVPDPGKALCNSNLEQQYLVCGPTNLAETGNRSGLAALSRIESHSLRSRIAEIENAAKLFLPSYKPKEERGILKSSDSPEVDKIRRVRTKSPGLIHVLSQAWTIAEYRIAVENLKGADMAISPDVDGIGFWQFHNAAQVIAAGEQAAHIALNKYKLKPIFPTQE
jgi:hypothetical protein